LLRGLGDGFPTWHAKLLAQETANPSGILSKLAETVVRPMDEYLEGVIRELLGKEDSSREPDDRPIQLCRMNIIGQCIFQIHFRQFTPSPVPKTLEPRQIVAIADQICRFSLGGIRAIAAEGRSK
jgi:TetR/AcrR family transcriptional regulator, regulator of cefoperazone and chloramphenicol sensitivity